MTDTSVPWRELLERSSALLGVLNLTGQVMWVNQTFAGALSSDPETVQGRTFGELLHPEDRDDALAVLAGAPAAAAEHRFAAGGEDWRRLVWQAGTPGDGLVLVTATDVTAAAAQREELAAGISHDVRAPLRAIDGFAALLLGDERTELPDVTRRYLALMRDAGTELGEQVDAVVALLRVAEQPLRRTTVDVAAATRDAADRRAPGGPAVETGPLPPASADPALLARVIDEVLSNAAKAGATRVTVRWDAEHEAYAFTDDGMGFDGRRADRAMHVFGKLHERERFPGAGVGLALARRIAERHGGHAWVEGAPGEGVTFRLALGP